MGENLGGCTEVEPSPKLWVRKILKLLSFAKGPSMWNKYLPLTTFSVPYIGLTFSTSFHHCLTICKSMFFPWMFDGKVPLWAYMPHLSSLPLTPSYLSKDVIGSYHESVHSLGSSANLPKPRLQIAKDFPSASPSQTRRIFSPGAVSEKREGKKKKRRGRKEQYLWRAWIIERGILAQLEVLWMW